MKLRYPLTAMTALMMLGASAHAQEARVIYDFASTDEGWAWRYNGDPIAVSVSGGNLNFQTIAGGIFPGFAEDGNNTGAAVWGGSSCTPLTGVTALEFDMGYVGADPTIDVQFFIQGGSAYDFVSLSTSTVTAGAGTTTLTVPLTALTEEQRARVRQIGFQINSTQTAVADWTISQIRSTGAPAGVDRVLYTFATGRPNSGLEGVHVNFGNAAVVGNDGGQNATGFTRLDPPSTDGAIEFVSQYVNGATGGGAITFGSGQGNPVSGVDGYLNRPLDLSGYASIEVDIKATGTTTAPISIQAFSQLTAGYTFNVWDAVDATLPVDGAFHTLSWNLTAGSAPVADSHYAMTLGLNLGEVLVGEGPVTYQIDEVRLIANSSDVQDWMSY